MSAPLTVVLTRPRQQAGDWLTRLAALGVNAVSLPLIEIVPGSPQAATDAWQRLPDAALAMFVSPNAVANFFAGKTDVWPEGTLAACVGPGSARALQRAGVPPHLIVQPPADADSLDSEHLWPLLANRDWQGRLALILRGDGGRDWLAERLREQGARTLDFSVYQRRCPVLDAAEQGLLADIVAPADVARFVWLFSSAEAIGNLASLIEADWSRQRAIATHARIAERARQLGLGDVVLARPAAAAVAAAAVAMQGATYNQFHCERPRNFPP